MSVSISELKSFSAAVFSQTRDQNAIRLCRMISELGECPACEKRRVAVRKAVQKFRQKEKTDGVV